MSEDTSSSAPSSETAKPEAISAPSGQRRNLMLMIVAIIVVIALIASALIVWPQEKAKLTAVIKGAETVQVDAGFSVTMTVVAKLGKRDVTNETGIKFFWSVTPPGLGSFSYKALWQVPFRAGITEGSGTVACRVTYQDEEVTPEKAIEVLPPFLDSVSISPSAKTIEPGKNWTFKASALSSVGLPITGVDVAWAITMDPGVSCVLSSTSGESISVQAGSVLGNATLTATTTVGDRTKSGNSSVVVGYLPPRSMDYLWYDMFNVPIGSWYDTRWPIYHQEERISDTYPYLFFYHSTPTGNLYLYSLLRLNITGRNASEINTNLRPEFLPVLSPTERGGTAVIDWYMQYLTHEELVTRYPSFAAQDDGWIIVLNGTTTLDKQAAKMVLNLTEGGYEAFSSWWNDNQATVVEKYSAWLIDEAMGPRIDIETAYESYYQLFALGLDATKEGDKITLRYDLVTWGMEALIMRWLHECFLPVEMWYEDMNFHVTVGPEWSTIDIDTAVTYALYAYETIDSIGNISAKPCWVFEPLLGDATESIDEYPSLFDRYAPLTKLNRQPDSPLYGTYMDYDVVPAAWNLSENETLKFVWPAGNQTFRYRVGQGLAQNVTEEIAVRYSEPWINDLPGQVIVNNTARELTFIGPINMYNWSRDQLNHTYLYDEWQRLSAAAGRETLPYGQPWIEFGTLDPIVLYLDHFDVIIQDAAPANDNVTVTVRAVNNYGFTYYDYRGTVNLTCSDPLAELPRNQTFNATNNGVRTLVGGVFFHTLGTQTLTVTNISAPPGDKNGTATLTVLPQRNVSSMDVDVYYLPAVNVPEDVKLTVFDQYGDQFLNYTGTVRFSSNRSTDVTLPLDYTFQLTEQGVHTIEDELTFLSTGWFNITAYDVDNTSARGWETNIQVMPNPEVIDHFNVSGIRNMLTRQKSDVTVKAYDQYGMLFKRYNGTIHFYANASGGAFPPDYTFTSDNGGIKEFKKGVTFSSPGVFTVSVQDTVDTAATGSQENVTIEFRQASETFRLYDMFEEKWGEWWPWRYPGYKTDIILGNESGKYTLLYNPDQRFFQGIIYAPYRWNMTGQNLSQVSVHNPEFMPILGTPEVPGAQATVDIYFQYLSRNWWNTYWKPTWNFPDSTMVAQVGDGWYPGVVYTVTMNRAAAEEWMGMPRSDPNPTKWWAINGGKYLQNWSAWILNEGNNRLDVWAGFEWPYYDLGTKMKLSVAANGDIVLKIGHLGEGFEILMTRWLNETNLCNHEAYYEDMTVHAEYYSNWMDLEFDAVCQYNLRAVKANESTTNEPAWAWQPNIIDYVASWNTPGGLHPSKFDPWANELYISWDAGDPSYAQYVPYDTGVCYFNLTDYQTFVIQLPTDDNNIGYYAETMPWDAIRRIVRGIAPYTPWPRGDGTNYDYTAYWPIMMNGSMSLGWYGNWTGPPYLETMYDSVNKTLTMVGPMNFENTHLGNGALYMGAPWIEFNVTAGGGGLSLPGPAYPPSESTGSTPTLTAVTIELMTLGAIVSATALAMAAVAVCVRRKT